MKRSHRRVCNAICSGYSLKVLGKQRFAWLTKWVSYGRYDEIRIRLATVLEMESLGLVACVDQYAHDREWVAVQPSTGAPT